MNLLPLDNALLKLKHNGLLTLILSCAASNDLNPVDYAVWGSASARDRFQRERLGTGFQSYFDSRNGVPRNAIVR